MNVSQGGKNHRPRPVPPIAQRCIIGTVERAYITFATFGLAKPMIGRLLGVADKITLELVFKMKRS